MKTIEKIRIMQSWMDGKVIQKYVNGSWVDCEGEEEPSWDWGTCEYRIKTNPTYRPYNNKNEAYEEAKKHGFFVNFNGCSIVSIVCFENDGVFLHGFKEKHDFYSLEDNELMTWQDDGTPLGIYTGEKDIFRK